MDVTSSASKANTLPLFIQLGSMLDMSRAAPHHLRRDNLKTSDPNDVDLDLILFIS